MANYCTIDNVKDRLGDLGVQLRLDDLPPTSVGDVLSRASRRIDTYAFLRYGVNLAKSQWVTDACADIAAAIMCRRRGNTVPESLEDEEAFWLTELEKIRQGYVYIPDIPELRVCAPVLSKQRVVLRPWPRVVTERRESTGKAEGYQQQRDPYDAINAGVSDWVI